MTNRLLFGYLAILFFIIINQINANQLTSLSKAEELKQINKLKLEIDELKKNSTNFYNYTIVCGGKVYESRAERTFADNTIPVNFTDFIYETYLRPDLRSNKCPKWSYNVETIPRSGGMDSLSIPENTRPGQKVYLLLAIDPESDPIYYFIRKAESETDDSEEIIFRTNVIRMGNSWFGEVILDKELDYEKKDTYNYLVYAYDGSNLLEKYSIIEITDVDDEKPEIHTSHMNYNLENKQFEFKIYENMSIGELINPNNKIIFTDIDTQSSQLTIRLTNLESGIADSPFSLNNNGELRVISGLDFESQKEYLLKLNVKDSTGGFAEEIIKVEIMDVPDLPPKFIEPKNLIHDSKSTQSSSIMTNKNNNNKFKSSIDLQEEGYVLFYENKIGPVFTIKAITQNNEPLGAIRYELIENLNENYLNSYFDLKKSESSNDTTWSLNCIKEISLNDKEEEYLQFVIRAIESPNNNDNLKDSKNYLYSDKRVTVKVVNGDLCIPTFNKEVYEFEIVENIKQLIEPIYVSDCDHGLNGKIYLSTANKDFSFKIDEVYRYSKLGIEMARSYDYEENLTADGHKIEFEIIARGSNQSLNKFESRSRVIIKILDINEFVPRFVLPAPVYFVKDGIPTEQTQRIFLYNVPEGQDFVLDVKAEDDDRAGDGQLFYFCRYLHPDDTFEIIHTFNSSSKIFNIRIPGRYFDANYKIPISFAVYVEDSEFEPKLRNEIIIYLRPQSDEQKSAYFEFPQYEFKIKEKSEHYDQKFKLKLLSDNLSVSKILLEELSDPLDLFKPDFEENFINNKDMISIIDKNQIDNDSELEINNELIVILYPSNANRDFDQLYIDNNMSDIYEYKLRVKMIEKPELFNDVIVLIKLIDSNDNEPKIVNLNIEDNSYLNATLNEDFSPNTLININDNHFIPKVSDFDFSPEFGLRSLYFKVNDSRFYVDHEYMSAELENSNTNSVSLLIRALTSNDNIDKEKEPVIWLNVTCEDNYFNRKLNKLNSQQFWSKSILIKLNITDSIVGSHMNLFNQSEYVFNVNESWTGVVGRVGKENNYKVDYKLDGYSTKQNEFLNEYFELNENLLSLKKPLDFEIGQRYLNFTVVAQFKTGSAVFRTNVVVFVNDVNDETPKCVENEYKFLISSKNSLVGNEIGFVYATDMDQDDSQDGLDFTINNDKFQLLRIDSYKKNFLQGVAIINREDLMNDEIYSLDIEVTDKLGKKGICKVIVEIQNDQPFEELIWSQDSYSAVLKENSLPDILVTKVQVKPVAITTSKFKIGYKIIGQNDYYKIDETNGEIRTSEKKINNEEENLLELVKQKALFVQAFLTIDSSTYWSTSVKVEIDIKDENDEYPIFVQPSNNNTQIACFRPECVFTFIANDSDLNDKISYILDEQILTFTNSIIKLPFSLDSQNGTLSFEIKELKNEDYLMLLKQDADLVRIKLTVRATDSNDHSTSCHLFVDLSINRMVKKIEDKSIVAHLEPISYKLESKTPFLNQINDNVYSIDESITPNTILAELSSYVNSINNTRLRMSENFKIATESKNDSISADLYFRYDFETSSLKLIRKLDFDIVKNISLSLIGDDDFKIDLEFVVNDSNDKIPELELDEQEVNKYGENLIIVSIDHLEDYINSISKTVSSTPAPPRASLPAIPELNLPARPSFQRYETAELDSNRASLKNFDKIFTVKTYKIIDSDKDNKFEVRFDQNETTDAVMKCFSVRTNGTHVLFEKNNQTTAEDEANLEENEHNKFKIVLNDGVNKNYFNGELYRVDARQLQRLSTFVPQNGRYKASLLKSSLPKAKVDLDPLIQIENQFPYDLHVKLVGEHTQYFDITPKIVRSSTTNFGPTEIILSLKESLEDNEDALVGLGSIDFSLQLHTSNDYLNNLLNTIGNMKIKIELKNENKYEPKIESVEPADRIIRLDEGDYIRKKIAKIQAYDKDRGDPGRVEYFLIGNSNLLEIDQTTGQVYLNGILDAESEQSIVFFCYARDLAPAPFGRNSELKRFEIIINNINEFKPVLQPGLTSLTLKEITNESAPEWTIIDEFRYDCYDRDYESPLEITLDSIRYVSKHDTFKYMDDLETSNRLRIKDLFKLVYDNETITKNYKSANLAYNNQLDYEKLYRPSETLIRIDVSCTDEKYESKSKLLVKIEDLNDNQPRFVEKNLVINKNESNVLETIVKLEAIDMDQSAQFGNQSLKYKIEKCQPNIYDIYIDERTGEISSKLLLDLDTDEIIKKRKEIYNDQLSSTQQVEFLNKYNRIDCQIKVSDSGLYSFSSDSVALSDKMNLTILINNMNDNPPEINLDKSNENIIEVKEGEQTRGAILQKISVFDKDGASDLECLFSNGHKTLDPFEFRTSLDLHDPHTTWCILKVRDDMIVDYDIVKKSIYLLELVVVDNKPPPLYPNGGISRAQIRVRVIPVNNKPPLFVNGNEETFYVLDSIRPGTLIGTVLATDMENPNPDRLYYVFDTYLPTRAYSKFELRQNLNSTNSYWGSVGLFTVSKLDVSESPYVLTVIAYDGPPEIKDTLSSRKIIKINVLNKGSMSVWVNETTGLPVDYYLVDLEEELPADRFVTKIKANIPDSYQTASKSADEVIYSIVNDNQFSNETNPFYKINSQTGEITTTGLRIDFENKEDLNLIKQMRNLKVSAQSSDGFFNYVTHVSINILDVNDNKPEFESRDYKFCVVENSTESKIGQVKAIDLDSGVNSIVKYKVNSDLFKIDEHTGEIMILDGKQIDRELNTTLKLEIIAYDSDDLEDKIELDICVLDINDNAPVFDNDLITSFEIEENSIDFNYKMIATDPDMAQNGTFYFYLDKKLNTIEISQKFIIDPFTGLLELISPLDFETKNEYKIHVTCSDNGSPENLKSNVQLTIDVIDLNDNSPKFSLSSKNQAKIFVNEASLPGTVLTRVEAIDNDHSNKFNKVNYKINSIYNVKSLDLTRVNSDLFKIDSNGQITLSESKKLEYEKEKEYLVEIEAYDTDKPELNDLFKLSIFIEPSNDKLPIFEQIDNGKRSTTLFRRSLAESVEKDYVIDIIKAVDPNQHGIKYFLDSVEEFNSKNETKPVDNDLFTVGENDGAVKTRKVRSFYSGESYNLKIRAVSTLNESLNSTLSLFVKVDQNQDSLFENRVVEITIDENLGPNSIITKLSPKVINRSLKYKFNQEFSTPIELFSKWFKIDYNTGLVQTNEESTIDCETSNEILLSIDVIDEPKSTVVENLIVKIKINDLNDNYPSFDLNYNYEVTMFEDDNLTANLERLITKFKAVDLDRSLNFSTIDYKIQSVRSMPSNSFKLVNDLNGEVLLYKLKGVNMDRDDPTIGSIIKLVVRAENTFDLFKFTDKEILIKLIDLNDNAPILLDKEEETKISLAENYRLNEKFYQVKAFDLDEPNTVNSELIFDISPKSSYVQIDSLGYLYLINELDYEREKKIDLTVTIYDKSQQPLITTKKVQIDVLNVNDNYPKFYDLPNNLPENKDYKCSFSLVENSEQRFLYKLKASDLDQMNDSFVFEIYSLTTFNQKLSKFIETQNNMFTLDRFVGDLKLIGKLDREAIDNYILKLRVTDQEINGVRLDSTVECYIKVLDVNDNRPLFLNTLQTEFKILPIVNERSLVGYFAATDLDLGLNSTIEYSLSDNKQLFEIDSVNSYLFLNLRKFSDKNHDLNDLYDLEIIARDRGVPERLESKLNIKVKIDPNYFSFDQQKMDKLDLQTPDSVHINENSEPGTKVGQIRVLNSFRSVIDETKQSQSRKVDLKFSLLTCNETFTINEQTGLIEVLNSAKLDYESIKEFLLIVEAQEVQQMSSFLKIRTGKSSFIVKLINVNDNSVMFNRNTYETNQNENQKYLPFELNLNELIQLTDLDLESSKSQAINQLNPIDLRIVGSDSTSFRLVEVSKFLYKLESIERFDYEFKNRFEFNLTAWDGKFKSSANVVVNILDENDHKPIFEKNDYVFRIDENSPMGTEIGTVKAFDLDGTTQNNQIFYKITNTHENIFGLNEKTGQLYVRDSNRLDREKIQSFNLTITAINIGKSEFFDTANIIIYLNDLNDQSPKFDLDILRVNIREKFTELPRLLAKVHAVDNDLAENGTINYFIETVNTRLYEKFDDSNENKTDFYLDKISGNLYLNSYLDADLNDVDKSYEIRIIAKDLGGNQGECLILVNLIDVNDHAPIIVSPIQTEFMFDENFEFGEEPLFELKSYDPDYRQSQVQYSIEKDVLNDWENFRIDANSGKVYSNIKFDHESKNEFNLRILVKDSGIMIDLINLENNVKENSAVDDLIKSTKVELITEYRVKIKINDLDDNEPEFSHLETFINVNVSENLEEGSIITVIPIARDRDTLPKNTVIKYYIMNGNDESKFKLNETSGELTLLDELERKEKDLYELMIRATSKSQGHIDHLSSSNDSSVLTLRLNVVKDKLFIEFDEQTYYVSVKLNDDKMSMNNSEHRQVIFEDLDTKQSSKSIVDSDMFKRSAIFYAKSHLIKRRLKRNVKFNIEMLQIIRFNEKLATKLPLSLVNSLNNSYTDEYLKSNLNYFNYLFAFDEQNGKVYINREFARKEKYNIGDRFLLTISAASTSFYSDDSENTITQLTVRLADKDYSFIMPLKRIDMHEILFECLNPLKPKYIPRILQADGVKIAIQDLLPVVSELTGETNHNLVLQVEAKQDHKTLDLDLFVNLWKDFSASNRFFNEFNGGLIERKAVNEARKFDRSEFFELYRPFYSSWLFWLLVIIGILLVIILVFFVFCIKITRKHHKISKKPGIIIEYPPGVNPVYTDGVLSLKNKSRQNSVNDKVAKVQVEDSPRSSNGFEEKEFQIDFDDEIEV